MSAADQNKPEDRGDRASVEEGAKYILAKGAKKSAGKLGTLAGAAVVGSRLGGLLAGGVLGTIVDILVNPKRMGDGTLGGVERDRQRQEKERRELEMLQRLVRESITNAPSSS